MRIEKYPSQAPESPNQPDEDNWKTPYSRGRWCRWARTISAGVVGHNVLGIAAIILLCAYI